MEVELLNQGLQKASKGSNFICAPVKVITL